MNSNHPPNEDKLFIVPRTDTRSTQPHENQNRSPNLAEKALLALSLLFLAVVAFAGYACLYGDWPRAKDFLLIFLPPVTALMGVAFTSSTHS